MSIIKEIASRLADGKEISADKGYMTSCPCCDSTGSLQIWDSGIGDIRVKCFNGCLTRDVLTSVQELEKKLANPFTSDNEDTDSRIMGITENELFRKKIPLPKMYLWPFLRAETISMVYGPPGVGKSWVGDDIAIGLTRFEPIGIKIGPWEVKNGCGVLIVDGERTVHDIQHNFNLLVKGMGPRGRASETNQLRIFSAIDESSGDMKWNLGEKSFREKISAHFKAQKTCKLLIIDNISSLTSGIPESSKTSWDSINAWLLKLRGKDVSTLLIHHSNKSGTDRGTSGRRDNVQNVICLERECEDADRVCAKVKFEKCRHLTPGQGKSFNLQLIGDDKTGLRLDKVAG